MKTKQEIYDKLLQKAHENLSSNSVENSPEHSLVKSLKAKDYLGETCVIVAGLIAEKVAESNTTQESRAKAISVVLYSMVKMMIETENIYENQFKVVEDKKN